MIIQWMLVVVLVFMSPAGPTKVDVEVPFTTKELCEFALKNGTISADLPLVGGEVKCVEKPTA